MLLQDLFRFWYFAVHFWYFLTKIVIWYFQVLAFSGSALIDSTTPMQKNSIGSCIDHGWYAELLPQLPEIILPFLLRKHEED